MTHLTCKRDKKRALVTPDGRIIHRGSGTLCKGTRLMYRQATELTAEDVLEGATEARHADS